MIEQSAAKSNNFGLMKYLAEDSNKNYVPVPIMHEIYIRILLYIYYGIYVFITIDSYMNSHVRTCDCART